MFEEATDDTESEGIAELAAAEDGPAEADDAWAEETNALDAVSATEASLVDVTDDTCELGTPEGTSIEDVGSEVEVVVEGSMVETEEGRGDGVAEDLWSAPSDGKTYDDKSAELSAIADDDIAAVERRDEVDSLAA
jgi:hypothetical protein